jgi:integrase
VVKKSVDKHVEQVRLGLGENTARGWSTYLDRVAERFKGRSYDSIGIDELRKLVNDVQKNALRRAVSKDGMGAADSMVSVLRRIWSSAVTDGLAKTNIANDLKYPRRTRAKERRALTEYELEQIWKVLATKSADPTLALLIFRTALETGMRRAELLGLTVGDLKWHSGCINISNDAKNKAISDMPITQSLWDALQLFIDERYEDTYKPSSKVFVYKKNQRPITRRWFENTSAIIRKEIPDLGENGELWFSWHLTRHTSGTLVERTAGFSMAMRFLRHSLNSMNVATSIYTSATLDELRSALSNVWGEKMAGEDRRKADGSPLKDIPKGRKVTNQRPYSPFDEDNSASLKTKARRKPKRK